MRESQQDHRTKDKTMQQERYEESSSGSGAAQHMKKKRRRSALKLRVSGIKSQLKQKKKRMGEIIDPSTVCLPRELYPHESKKKKFNILCLDGGGMRGLVQLEMLRHIEERTGNQIHEIFDMICGTSTGAILACLSGFHMTTKQGRDCYNTMGVDIFSKKKRYMISVLKDEHKGMYCSKQLEQGFLKVFGDNLLLHPDCPDPKTKIVIVTAELNSLGKYETVLFRNYHAPIPDRGSDFEDVKVHEAIRCSTAAPFYFDSAYLRGSRFVDGGVINNNPSLQGLMEARTVFGYDQRYTVLNLGNGERKRPLVQDFTDQEGVEPTVTQVDSTGPAGPKRKKGGYFSKNIVRLLNVCADNDRIVKDVEKYIASSTYTDQIDYHRFSPPNLGDHPLAVSDPLILSELINETSKYVSENLEDFQKMCDRLTVE